MPKFKVKSFPPVRVDDLFYDQTVKCALEADEVLSVYIRKAIKMRNAQIGKEKLDKAINMTKEELEAKIKPDTIYVHPDTMEVAEKMMKPPKQKAKDPEFKTFFKESK